METSIVAAIRNRLAWISTPAINVVFMIPRGDFASFADHAQLLENMLFIIAKSTINHRVKLAKFFIIFRNCQSGASRWKTEA